MDAHTSALPPPHPNITPRDTQHHAPLRTHMPATVNLFLLDYLRIFRLDIFGEGLFDDSSERLTDF